MIDFIEETIRQSQLRLRTEPTDEPNVFRCVMESPNSTMSRTMTMKEGLEASGLNTLLHYYACELQQVYQCDDILEWADENGLDLKDHVTRQKFDQLVQDETDLRLVLGDVAFNRMMAGLEISQAIANARPR